MLSKARKPNLELNGHQNIPRTMLHEWKLFHTAVGKCIKNKKKYKESDTNDSIKFLHLVFEHCDKMPVLGI